MRPNKKLADMWSRAAESYYVELPGSPAEEYLESRGLLNAADQFMLGYVAEPAPGHEERFTGMLSIPYLTPLGGVVAFKFRSLDPAVDKRFRYNSPTGQKHHLYNVNALVSAIDTILIVEGELDAIASTLAGYPAVAVPGVQGFKPHFKRCFDGVGKILVVTDNDDKESGDNPGQELARKLIDVLPNAVRVTLPEGHDVNSTIQSYGARHFAELVGAVE